MLLDIISYNLFPYMFHCGSLSLSLVSVFHYESYCPTLDPLVSTAGTTDQLPVTLCNTCPQEMLVVGCILLCPHNIQET